MEEEMRKRILVLLLALATAVTGTTSVYADKKSDAQKQANQAKENLNAVNQQLKEIENQQKTLKNQMSGMNQQLVAILVAKKSLENDIADTQVQIQQAQKDLEAAKLKEEKQYADMKLRIQFMYENGDSSFISEILEAKTIAEVINRAEYYNQVYSADRKMLINYQETKLQAQELEKGLQQQLAGMEEMKSVQVAQQKQYESILAQLDTKLGDANTQLSQAQAMATKYQKTVEQQNTIVKNEIAKEAARKKAEEEARRKAEEEAKNNQGGGSSGGNSNETSTATGQAIVAYAKTFLGIEYVWGGKDPSGFDCSGFTSYVYRHFGIYVPSYSGSQAYVGKAVSYGEMQPGDLIVYEPKYVSSMGQWVGHVAIYIGGGQFIHAPQSNDVVKISSNPKYRAIKTIRRLI